MALPTEPTGRTDQPPGEVPLADRAELPRLDPSRPRWPGRETSVGSLRVHVRDIPGPADGPAAGPAVYVHGMSGSSNNWTDLAALLSGHAAGLAVDLPGFGRSGPAADGGYRPDAQAAVLTDLLETLGRPVQLLGNSLGGVIAMLVAQRRPDLVRSLTLVSPAMPDLRPDPRRMSDPWLALAWIPAARRRFAALTPQRRAEQLLKICFAEPSRASAHRLAELAEEVAERAEHPWAVDAVLHSSLGLFRAYLARPSLWSVAARVRVPTLVVWGDRDRLVAPRLATRTVAALRTGRLLMLPSCGHTAQLEHPVPVARAVLGLWKAVAAGEWEDVGQARRCRT